MKNAVLVFGLVAALGVSASAEVFEPTPQRLAQDVTGYRGNVYFVTNGSRISAAEVAILSKAAQQLKSDPTLVIECAGFTDDRGSDASNQRLSVRRAKQVRNLMIRKYGAPAARVIARGYGEQFPSASNSTEAGRTSNRRVEIRADRSPNVGTAYPVEQPAMRDQGTGRTNVGNATPVGNTAPMREVNRSKPNVGPAYPVTPPTAWN